MLTWRTWRLGERSFIQIVYCSRKGAKGAKEFLRNAGLGGLGGLARDSSRRFFVLAKAQRTQRIPTECWSWRLGGLARDDSRARIYFLAKARRTQRISYGMLDLAAWRLSKRYSRRWLINLAKARRTQGILRNDRLCVLGGLARDIHADCLLISQRRGGRKGFPTECWTWRTWRLGERI